MRSERAETSGDGAVALPEVPLILTMAVGPGGLLGAIELLDSARAFLHGPYRAVVVDDSGELGTWIALRRYREARILRNVRRQGIPGLMASLQRTFRYALRFYDFGAILRVDQDALITGPGVDGDILAFFRAHPSAGMIGSRRVDPQWRKVLEANEAMWGPYLRQAREHGYEAGESVLGGAYALSRACVAALDEHGYLDLVPTGEYVAEDVAFSLLARAAGFELREFTGPNQPFALAWKGLPMPAPQILAKGKKVVHSVKFQPADLSIRTIFARARRRHMSRGVGRLAADTVALAGRTRRLRLWLKWRSAVARAFRDRHPVKARRILRRCARVTPTRPAVWVALAVSFLPGFVGSRLNTLRIHTSNGFGQLMKRAR